jgi:hypothetical protein
MIVVATLMIVPCALAEPLNTYCVSQTGQSKEPHSALPEEKPVRVTVPINGEPFHVVVSRANSLLLIRGEDAKSLAEVRVPQYEYGGIKTLALTKDNWLWVDGDETDYMIPLNFNQKLPTLGPPVALPELYIEPCSIWSRLWLQCRKEEGIYSRTLNRVFITGHRASFLGQADIVSYEVIKGKARVLPKKAHGARFLVDLPKLNGALFRGSSHEALFYDGITFTTLLAGSPEQLDHDSQPTWRIETTPLSQRTFLTNTGFIKKSRPFLVELKAGPALSPIALSKDLYNSWLSLFTIPNDQLVFGVTRHSVVAQVESGLQTVVTVPAPFFIDGPAGIWQASDGAIAFVVQNPNTNSFTNYFIVSASQRDKCQNILSVDQPIVLGKGVK